MAASTGRWYCLPSWKVTSSRKMYHWATWSDPMSEPVLGKGLGWRPPVIPTGLNYPQYLWSQNLGILCKVKSSSCSPGGGRHRNLKRCHFPWVSQEKVVLKKIQNAKLKTWILVKNICQTLKGHKSLSWVQICPTSASVIKSGLPKCQNHKTHPRKPSCTSSYKRASQLWHWKYWLCCLIGKRITTISSILSFFIPFILNYTKL